MKHYVGEFGTAIILDTGVALATATSLKIKYQKPDGTVGEWTGTAVETTKIRYMLQTGDISIAGRWQFQAFATFSGSSFHGETIYITFSELFDESVFCMLQDVKAMMGQTVDQTDDDALIESFIGQETEYIKKFCRRDFFYGTYTERYNGDGGSQIFLDNYPIVSVTSIHDDTDRVFGTDTLVDPADYYIDEENGIIELDGIVTERGKGNIKVIYLGGFKTIPQDLGLACAQRVYADYLEVKGGANALEGETVTYKPSNLRKQAEVVLERYRKIV